MSEISTSELREHCAACIDEAVDIEVIMAHDAALRATLAQRCGWQHCATHGTINADHAWGCPDCVTEMRQQLASRDAEIARLREEAHTMREELRKAKYEDPLTFTEIKKP
jgi:hypothetical protein